MTSNAYAITPLKPMGFDWIMATQVAWYCVGLLLLAPLFWIVTAGKTGPMTNRVLASFFLLSATADAIYKLWKVLA